MPHKNQWRYRTTVHTVIIHTIISVRNYNDKITKLRHTKARSSMHLYYKITTVQIRLAIILYYHQITDSCMYCFPFAWQTQYLIEKEAIKSPLSKKK